MTTSISPVTNYVAVSRRQLDLEDYIDVARRHVGWIMGPLLAGIVVSIVVAFAMPDIYVSQAELQITPAQVSDAIVKTTINQRLNERIMQMETSILSRTSLSQIIQDPRLDLYKSDRAKEPLEDVIEKMRTQDIKIAIESDVGDASRHASAFTIRFFYPDRVKARDTVQALVTKFTDQNQDTQATAENVVRNLVHDELSEAKAKLDALNEQLTKFRVDHSGQLPEQTSLNIAALTSLQQQSTSINDSLNRLAQERVQLDTHLQTLQSQLQLYDMFEKDEATATGAGAPPLMRQQSERLVQLNKTIEQNESTLAQLKLTYRSNFPDIRDMESRIAEMKRQRDDLQKKQDEEFAKLQDEAAKKQPQKLKKATNYAAAQSINNVQGQIDATKALVKTNEMQRESLQKTQQANSKEIESYQQKLAATSGIEASYQEMIQNQKEASEKYLELQRKQELAEQNNDLLQRKAGENLDVLDPPSLPTTPAKPNRWMIVGAGLGISFILGLAFAGVQEAKDTSLKNLKDVRAYTNLPVLSSIPLLENTMLVRRKRRIAYLAWSAGIIIGLLAVSASLYYHSLKSV